MPFVAKQIATGLARPLFACSPPGDVGRLFIVEQGGSIKILDLASNPPAVKPAPFLVVGGLSTGNEQGLLGLAFHPKYATNRTFFVNYTDATGTTVVASYTAKADNPDLADPATAKIILKVAQPFANHNGGWIAFGPDGFLYIGMGDGGASFDPGNRAQNLGELLGKMLRIDVDRDQFPAEPERNYAIPPSNPFVNATGARPEIWSYGLRNPWRCAFDRQTKELYIADVGQDQWEEVNVQPAGQGGQNYGWRLREGRHDTGLGPTTGVALTDPIAEYDHGQGVAVVGGHVYRGAKIPELAGAYLFADFVGPIWMLKFAGGVATPATEITTTLFPGPVGRPNSISSFGEDAVGEVYLMNRMPGRLFRIEAIPGPTTVAATAVAVTSRKKMAVQSVRWGAPKAQEASAKKSAMLESAEAVGVQVPYAPGTPVEEARALLQAAAAIEHELLVQYLYALYSLDDKSPARGVLAPDLKAIAVEEMGHLMTVQNLLLAIGGEVYFARESPKPAADPFAFRLQPLSLTSLAKYVTAESPLPEQITEPGLLKRANRAYVLSELTNPGGGGAAGINHVGILYAKLYWLFQKSDNPEGPWTNPSPGPFASGHIADADFVNASARQMNPDVDGLGENQAGEKLAYVAPVRNRAEALAALYQIAVQGEGWVSGDSEESHFERFFEAFDQFAKYSDNGDEPALPVPTDPTIGEPGPSANRNAITHPSAKLWVELSNVRFQMLIGELWLAILLPANEPLRQVLFGKSLFPEMKTGVGQIAKKLALLPRSATFDPQRPRDGSRIPSAGAPFQLPPLASLPSDVAGWKKFLRDRIEATAKLRTRLESNENTIPLEPIDISHLNSLKSSDEELLPLLV